MSAATRFTVVAAATAVLMSAGPALAQMDHAHSSESHAEHGQTETSARSADYSDGYAPSPGTDHMADNQAFGGLAIDKFEYTRPEHGDAGLGFEGEAWYGKNYNKLWLKAEGETAHGATQRLRTEALWAHAVSPFWNSQLGVRHDSGIGPNRDWIALGVQGLAPYHIETQAEVYFGEAGRTAARFEFEYDAFLTQRLILQPKIELNLYGRDDPERGIGAGVSSTDLGLRLRYRTRMGLAPYVGVTYERSYGATADFARAAGEAAHTFAVVAGIEFEIFH